MMLPDQEISRLLYVAEGAIDYAERGRRADGNALLLEGLHRARRLQRVGLPWGAELVSRYEFAITRFADHYGLPHRQPGLPILRPGRHSPRCAN